MFIAVVNLTDLSGESTCAVNLACELAGPSAIETDRWGGKRSVVFVDATTNRKAAYHCSQRRLPVSCEHVPLQYPADIDHWIRRVAAIEVDYVVIEGPSRGDVYVEAILSMSDLMVIPCSVDDRDLAAANSIVRLIGKARSTRMGRWPRCLLVPTCVDGRIDTETDIKTTLEQFGEPVTPPIHQRIEFADAFVAGRWIGEYAPNSFAHLEIKVLAARVEDCIGRLDCV